MTHPTTTRRRCEATGCRAWAMRGATHCVSHRTVVVDSLTDDDRPDGRQERVDRFATSIQSGNFAGLIDDALQAALSAFADQRSLTAEIGALRLMVQRIVATDLLDGDPRDVTLTLTRLVDTIIRARRTEQSLVSTFEDDLRAVVTRVFRDKGLEEVA